MEPAPDPDGEIVARVQRGEVGAFEELVRRHGRRVRRTLGGMLRRDEDVDDALQDTFTRAYQHLGEFRGAARFSTWLTRIAINAALQRLRQRRDFEVFDETLEPIDRFHPPHAPRWQDDPERLYSKAVTRELVWKAVQQLPLKYRVVVVLRDLQQLSTAEAAAALGLGVPALKARLLRGRLMLRDALSPYFAEPDEAAGMHG